MRVRVARVETQRFAIATLRLGKANEVVIDIPEIEMRFEEVRLESDGALVERLRLGELVAAVVNVGEIDQRRHEVRIELERLAVRCRSLVEIGFPIAAALVEH